MTPLRALTTVYSYYLPEVRAAVSRLAADYPHEVFLRSVSPGLDDFHAPIAERLVAAWSGAVPALAGFAHRYPTAGSEEGIREYMTRLAASGARRVLMLRGDYEGYREVARSRGLEAIEVEEDEDFARHAPGDWFLSDPCARDGNRLPAGLVDRVLAAGHRVFYDLSYLGSTGPASYDLAHPGVAAAALSFSKTFGLFYYRIGFLFTREPVPALYANRWFKNVWSLLVAERVLAELDLPALARRYKELQRGIVAGLAREHGLALRPSDAFLLAWMPAAEVDALASDARAALARFRRHRAYRFCLTPYLLERAG